MPNPRLIERTAADLRRVGPGPHLVGHALAAGITYSRLRAAVAAGSLMQLRKGIVVPTEDWWQAPASVRRTWSLLAATRVFPGSFGSHDTAALIWGLPDYALDVGGDPPLTHITREGASRVDGWVRVHGCDTPVTQTANMDGLPITTLPRTSIDLAARRSLRTGLVFVDAAMRTRVSQCRPGRGLRDAVRDPSIRASLVAEWDAAVAPFSRHRWVTHVRTAIRHADPASESVLESLSRAAMVEDGLPLPRCGVPMVVDGATYWLDFLWDEFRLIGEADGRGKYADIGDLVAEKRRQEALESMGFRVVRWGFPEVSPSPDVMLARLRRALGCAPPSRRSQLP